MEQAFQFKPIHLDVLKEIGNIGSGHAATALSELTSQSIDISVPAVTITSIMDVLNQDESEKLVVAAYFEIQGDLEGHLFITFETTEVEQLLRQVVHDPSLSLDAIRKSPYYQSALSEVGNILAGSYISALSDFSNTNLHLTPPQIGMDMVGAIIGEGLIDVSINGDQVILIDALLRNRETQDAIKGSFLFLPQPESVQTLFSKLGVENE